MELITIQHKIFEVRGQKVMFDFDLAALYDVETRVLNQAVKRNADRFPKDFMFRLKQKEWDSMSSHFVMTYPPKRPKIALPYAFTEHGVTMMASVLRSDTAVKMNIAIVRAFIALRKFAGQYGEMLGQLKELKDRVGNHDEQLNEIYNAIENLLDEKAEQKKWGERVRIGYKS